MDIEPREEFYLLIQRVQIQERFARRSGSQRQANVPVPLNDQLRMNAPELLRHMTIPAYRQKRCKDVGKLLRPKLRPLRGGPIRPQ